MAYFKRECAPTQSWHPITPPMLQWKTGNYFTLDSKVEREVGAALALGVVMLMRAGEVESLHTHDVLIQNGVLHVTIRRSKTDQGGRGVTISTSDFQELWKPIIDLKRKREGGPLIKRSDRRVWLVHIQKAFPGPKYVFHSLRHGGASYRRKILQTPVEQLMQLGRWRSRASVDIYSMWMVSTDPAQDMGQNAEQVRKRRRVQ